MHSQFSESSGLIPLVSNPSIGISWYPCLFSRLVFCAMWGRVLPLLLDCFGGSQMGFSFFTAFLCLMYCLLEALALTLSHQMARLWALFGSFSPQGRMQLGSVIAHYWFVQGGQICCCFHQVADDLLCRCYPGCSAPSSRWDNLVLCTTHSPIDYLSDLLWPCSGRLTCCPISTLRLCSLSCPHSQISATPPPNLVFPRWFSILPHPQCQW
jgi:hypothetical protein